MLEKITAGDNVVSYCSKCKLGLDHLVMAVEGESIAKVKCRTCGGMHKYRDPADIKKPRTVKKKEDAMRTAEMFWASCLSEAKGRERAYDMTGRYRVGDIVLHSTFGKGVVRKLYINKCDVLFRDKERLMASSNH